MRTTREVTRQNLAAARRIHAQLERSERVSTRTRDIAQALANIQWVMDNNQSRYETTGEY